MERVTTIGLDLAKGVFQVHGVDADGRMVLRRKLRRGEVEAFCAALPPATVGVEACGGGRISGRAPSAGSGTRCG